MYVPESLKLNKHEVVKIPSNKDYFARLGKMELGENAYTGDEVARIPGRKIDEVIAGEFAAEREMREKAEAEAAAAAAAAAAADKKDNPKNEEK